MFKNKYWFHMAALTSVFMLVAVWFTYNYYAGERVQANQGIGWDGTLYAGLAKEGINNIIHNHLASKYLLQRALPACTVHFISNLLNYNLNSPAEIIKAFYFYNCMMIIISFLFFLLIAKHLKWSKPVSLAVLSMVFVNYAILKMTAYYPVLTDTTAFTIGIVTFYCYLKDKFFLLLLTTFLGAFVFPSIIYAALPLLIFKVKSLPPAMTSSSMPLNKINISVVASLSLLVILYIFHIYIRDIHSPSFINPTRPFVVAPSLIFLFLYLCFSLIFLFDYKYIQQNFYQHISLQRLLLSATLFLLIKFIVARFSDGSAGALTIKIFLWILASTAIANPGIGIVTHTMYFGPGVLLTVLLWKEVVEVIKQYGLGVMLFVGLYVLLSIGSESRQYVNAWPIFAILIGDVLNKRRISWNFAYLVLLISFVLSRFWLPLNIEEWDGNLLKFPDQMYFMSTGPWTSNLMYAVFLAVIVIVILAIYAMLQPLKLVRASEDRDNMLARC